MADDVIRLRESKQNPDALTRVIGDALGTIYTSKYLFQNRDAILELDPNHCHFWCAYPQQPQDENKLPGWTLCNRQHNGIDYEMAPIHFEGQSISLESQLNFLCNGLLETYKVACERGDNHVKHWVNNAFAQGYCIDARSQGFIAYSTLQENRQDSYGPFPDDLTNLTKTVVLDVNDPKTGKPAEEKVVSWENGEVWQALMRYFQQRLAEGNEVTEHEGLDLLKSLEGKQTKNGFITAEDIEEYIKMFRNVFMYY